MDEPLFEDRTSRRLRALSVRQPWADLIIAGEKDIENRTWSTDHRGPLAIHASKSTEALRQAGIPTHGVVLGAVIGIVDLVDIVQGHRSRWARPGAYHWVLARPRRMSTPVFARGRTPLFFVEVPAG